MYRRITVALVVVIVALPAFAAPPSNTATKAGASQVPLHVQAAQQLVADVALSDTTYDHGKGVVHWKGRDGATKSECHTDCSGLLNNLLEAAYGVTESDRREWLGTGRPTAKVYHDAIAAQNRFERITNVSQLLPGDVLAAKYVNGENTGHVMIVAGARSCASLRPPLFLTRSSGNSSSSTRACRATATPTLATCPTANTPAVSAAASSVSTATRKATSPATVGAPAARRTSTA